MSVDGGLKIVESETFWIIKPLSVELAKNGYNELDSLRELSLNTPLCDANTVPVPIKNNSGGNHVIKDIFAYRKKTSGAIVKRTPALDSTH